MITHGEKSDNAISIGIEYIAFLAPRSLVQNALAIEGEIAYNAPPIAVYNWGTSAAWQEGNLRSSPVSRSHAIEESGGLDGARRREMRRWQLLLTAGALLLAGWGLHKLGCLGGNHQASIPGQPSQLNTVDPLDTTSGWRYRQNLPHHWRYIVLQK